MAEKDQLEIVLEILRQFPRAGILKDIMLIGSWCLYFYRQEFKNPESIPAVRTLDMDFLIPDQRKLSSEADVPAVLRSMGFAATYNRANDLVVYDHPGLRVEFLIPEVGRGFHKPQEIKKLHVKAQGIRCLNLLADYPRFISYENFRLKVPEPAVFAIHKFIISARRSKADKRERDIEAAVGILEYLFSDAEEKQKIHEVLNGMPQKWRDALFKVSRKHFPKLEGGGRVTD